MIDINDYYDIDRTGKVTNRKTGREIKPYLHDKGRLRVDLSVNGKRIRKYIHRLVAETLLPNPYNYPDVIHIDNDITNNNIDNLIWGYQKEFLYRRVIDYKYYPRKNLTDIQLIEIWKLYWLGYSYSKIAKHFNVSDSLIRGIINRCQYVKDFKDYDYCLICNRKDTAIKYSSKYHMVLCKMHINQLDKHNKITKLLPVKQNKVFIPNEIIVYNDYAEIRLYDKYNNEKARTKIDLDDIERCKNYRWTMVGNGYVGGYINYKTIPLHRFINDTPKGLLTDHINHDTLDNRKCNLRTCTHQQNNRNSNNPKGVTWDKQKNKWKAWLVRNGCFYHLGNFDNESDAIECRLLNEVEMLDEFRPYRALT